ncbi:hypothetical protein [Lentibacillus jeotgali]|uniref:hypothetical protein n=1 Tax=Lentibacillus jeotgali TaxID=558169 RepID=UPI0002626FA0|nr:hypothetical protein [Lentibacillus jeotgali]
MSRLTIGLIPCPDTPEKLAKSFKNKLPEFLSAKVSDQVKWSVEVTTDPLIGSAEDTQELMEETESIKKQKNWDFAICLTDLPLFDDKDLVVADGDYNRQVGQISIPAFGSFPLTARIRKVLLQVVKELHSHQSNNSMKKTAVTAKEGMSDREKGAVSRQFLFSLIRREHSTPMGKKMDLHLVIRPRFQAKLRVLAGMTYANRPWGIIPSFKPVVAVAFATGAYGLIFPTLWKLSGAFELFRFLGLMVGAIFSIVVWIIISHNLWEKPAINNDKAVRKLYNRTTVATLTVAVLCYYITLFVLFLLTVLLFVPPDLFQSLGDLNESVSFWNYTKLAWLATSIATFAGSIGVGLENEEMVRNIMYGYRQSQRSKYYRGQQDEERNETKDG